MIHFDQTVFYYLNKFADSSGLLNFIGVFFAEYSAYILVAILLILLFFPKAKQAANRIMISVSIFTALVARLILKEIIILFYHRPRPYMVLPNVHKLISTTTTDNFQSFPSGHAIFFFALAMTLFCFNKKIGTWYFAAAVIMGIARVFAGVHWPTDIVAGATIGVLTGYIIYIFYCKYEVRVDSAINKMFRKLGI